MKIEMTAERVRELQDNLTALIGGAETESPVQLMLIQEDLFEHIKSALDGAEADEKSDESIHKALMGIKVEVCDTVALQQRTASLRLENEKRFIVLKLNSETNDGECYDFNPFRPKEERKSWELKDEDILGKAE